MCGRVATQGHRTASPTLTPTPLSSDLPPLLCLSPASAYDRGHSRRGDRAMTGVPKPIIINMWRHGGGPVPAVPQGGWLSFPRFNLRYFPLMEPPSLAGTLSLIMLLKAALRWRGWFSFCTVYGIHSVVKGSRKGLMSVSKSVSKVLANLSRIWKRRAASGGQP